MLSEQIFDLRFPDHTVFGRGAVAQTGETARDLGTHKAFVVTDPGVAASRIAYTVRSALGGARFAVARSSTPSRRTLLSAISRPGARS